MQDSILDYEQTQNPTVLEKALDETVELINSEIEKSHQESFDSMIHFFKK